MTEATVSPTDTEFLLQQLKALANPKRLQILHLLMEGIHCNCELGEALNMSPNLISHHMSILRDIGLVDVERDAVDARWIYFSVNMAALAELNQVFSAFFDVDRIQPRRPTCGPQGSVVPMTDIVIG
jgi:ArsR family transcriptional regulator